jgi:hypothetical protein
MNRVITLLLVASVLASGGWCLQEMKNAGRGDTRAVALGRG